MQNSPSQSRRIGHRGRATLGVLAVAALAIGGVSTPARASPGLAGTRNLGMGHSARASAVGVDAALANPAALSVTPMFEAEPLYQLRVSDRTHGIGFVITDSLNNPRLAIGLGYMFFRGSPQIDVPLAGGGERMLELSRFGHEVALPISVVAVPNWVAIGTKVKYQYTSLRFLDDEGIARDAHDKLEALGLDFSLIFVGGRWMRIAVVAENLIGNHPPAYDDEQGLELEGIDLDPMGTVDPGTLRRVSDYPLSLTHALAVYPLGSSRLNFNVDATYDLTSYADQGRVRPLIGGSGEIVLGPVPLRVGAYWDGAGRGDEDDGVFVSGGLAYQRDAQLGGWGADIGVGVSQQVAGENLATTIGVNIGLRMHPDR